MPSYISIESCELCAYRNDYLYPKLVGGHPPKRLLPAFGGAQANLGGAHG